MLPLLDKGVDPAPRCNRLDLALMVGLSLVGLALRLPGLDQGLWFDEIWTLAGYVRLPAGEIIRYFSLNNHILYSLCAHLSIAWFGESAWALRLPAMIFGVAMIPSSYYLGRQLAPRSEAFLVALFLTLNYQFVWFSQNARGYTGLALGAVLATIFFIKLIGSAKAPARSIVAYAVVAALTIWIHLTAIVVILVHGIVFLVLAYKAARKGEFRAAVAARTALLLTGLLGLVLYAPSFGGVMDSMDRVVNLSVDTGGGCGC